MYYTAKQITLGFRDMNITGYQIISSKTTLRIYHWVKIFLVSCTSGAMVNTLSVKKIVDLKDSRPNFKSV